MSEPRLVIFDVDGTLVDSQGIIVASMETAFDGVGIAAPSPAQIKSIVGLSLDTAVRILAPDLSPPVWDRLVALYKDAFLTIRQNSGTELTSPLFPGARSVLDTLRADPWTLLAIATGKSRRGLDFLIEGHGLAGYFTSQQVADFHPSKPHPSMILTALSETGIDAARTVMIGDTSFDMDMARAAGVAAIGVSWGYHSPEDLDADVIVDRFDDLTSAIDTVLETRT